MTTDLQADVKAQRVSQEQRQLMLNFMKEHPALATNRFVTPDGAKHKQRLLAELSLLLNSCANGASKSNEKWLKSWQDWRSDTKSKAAKIRRSLNATGGGPPCKLTLTPLEEELLAFLGNVIVDGHNVVDPMALQENGQEPPVEVHVQGGQQVGDDFQIPLVLTNVEEAPPQIGEAPPRIMFAPISVPPPKSSPSLDSDYSGPSRSASTPSSPKRRKRTITGSTDSEAAEEKLLDCVAKQSASTETSVQIQKEQLKIQEEQLKMQREMLKLQQEQGERYAATFDRIADAVIAGINTFQQYLLHIQEKP